MIYDILMVAAGAAALVAGWRAWTGRWRSWAHPYSGAGLLPLALIPIGLAALVAPFIGSEDPPVWAVVAALPAVITFPILTVSFFYRFKRWSAFLRPRWLPEGWQVPHFVDIRGNAIVRHTKARRGVSVESAENAVEGPPRARWGVTYVEEDPAFPMNYAARPGWRDCELLVGDDLIAVAQVGGEDRLHGSFVVVLERGDVERLEYRPAPKLSWRSVIDYDEHYPAPRLVVHTRAGAHDLRMVDGRFRRATAANLALLGEVLAVAVPAT